MQWVPVIAVLMAMALAVPSALAVALRIAGIWRGGWRDIRIAAWLSWLAVGIGLLVLFALRAWLGNWRLVEWVTGTQAGGLLIVCASTFIVVAGILRRRGRSARPADQ